MFCGGELEALGPLLVGKLMKFSGCFWWGDIAGRWAGWKADVETFDGGDGRWLGDIARCEWGEWWRSKRSSVRSRNEGGGANRNCDVMLLDPSNLRKCWRTRGSSSNLELFHRSRMLPYFYWNKKKKRELIHNFCHRFISNNRNKVFLNEELSKKVSINIFRNLVIHEKWNGLPV